MRFTIRWISVVWAKVSQPLCSNGQWLSSMFSPLWNRMLDGFGNHDPGAGRYNQQRSPWDVVHPGRPWAAKLKPNSRSPDEFLEDVMEFLK